MACGSSRAGGMASLFPTRFPLGGLGSRSSQVRGLYGLDPSSTTTSSSCPAVDPCGHPVSSRSASSTGTTLVNHVHLLPRDAMYGHDRFPVVSQSAHTKTPGPAPYGRPRRRWVGAGPDFYLQRVPRPPDVGKWVTRSGGYPAAVAGYMRWPARQPSWVRGRTAGLSALREPEPRSAEIWTLQLPTSRTARWIYPAHGRLHSFGRHVMIDARGPVARSAVPSHCRRHPPPHRSRRVASRRRPALTARDGGRVRRPSADNAARSPAPAAAGSS
jgi:hypothetical protein